MALPTINIQLDDPYCLNLPFACNVKFTNVRTDWTLVEMELCLEILNARVSAIDETNIEIVFDTDDRLGKISGKVFTLESIKNTIREELAKYNLTLGALNQIEFQHAVSCERAYSLNLEMRPNTVRLEFKVFVEDNLKVKEL